MSIFLIQHVYKAYLHHYDYHKPLICSQYFKLLMMLTINKKSLKGHKFAKCSLKETEQNNHFDGKSNKKIYMKS